MKKKALLSVAVSMTALLLSFGARAQKSVETVNGIDWYLDKTEAFDSARAHNKSVLIMWGRYTCSLCNKVKANLAEPQVKTILDNGYVLWFFNADSCSVINCFGSKPSEACSEVSGYYKETFDNGGYTSLPFLCIVNPADPADSVRYCASGLRTADELVSILNNAVVANDFRKTPAPDAYAYGNCLYLSGCADEAVSVYSVSGATVDRFNTAGSDGTVVRNAASYPRGVLIVTGSSGWVKKVVLR